MKRQRAGVFVIALVAGLAWVLLPGPADAHHQLSEAFDIKIGGFIQFNIASNTDENGSDADGGISTATANGVPTEGRETLRWTAKSTRITVSVTGPDVWGAKSRAYIESDFDGAKDAASAATNLRLRRAFIRLTWPLVYMTLGQENMLLSRAVGTVSEISTTLQSKGDRTGGGRQRSPKILVGTTVPLGDMTLDLSAAALRNQTDRSTNTTNVEDSGSRSNRPAFEALAELTVKNFLTFGRNATFAVSGYQAEEVLVGTATSSNQRIERWVENHALQVEAILPLGPAVPGVGAFEARGGMYWAENMDRVNLGNNAPVVFSVGTKAARVASVSSEGWWIEGEWYGVLGMKELGLGGGTGRADDARNDVRRAVELTAALAITRNEGWWVFANYAVGPLLTSLQYMYVDTTRLASAGAAGTAVVSGTQETHDSQVMLQFIYKF